MNDLNEIVSILELDDCPPPLEQRAAFPADQHGVLPFSKATYYPQSQPLPSRNSRQEQRSDWTFVGKYADEGISGRTPGGAKVSSR